MRINGKNPSLMDGFKLPNKHFFKLFKWSIIVATVSIILTSLSKLEKRKRKGISMGTHIASKNLSVMWNVATFFVIPIILFEDYKIFPSIKRSLELFKKTWGESLTSQFSIGLIFFLFALPMFLILILAIVSKIIILIIIVFSLSFIYIGILIILASSVNGILRATLYQYATTHKDPHIYNEELMKTLFK